MDSVPNQFLVPPSSILLFKKQDVLGFVESGIEARRMKQHESKQSGGLRVRRRRVIEQQSAQPGGFFAEISSDQLVRLRRVVTFIEEQIQHGVNRFQATLQRIPSRNLKGDFFINELSFRSRDTLL